MLPNRIPTGIRKTTIPNPALKYGADADSIIFQGNPTEFDFKHQKSNYEKLQSALKENDTTLTHISFANFKGWTRRHTTFVCVNDSQSIIWEKQENRCAGSGHNRLYIGGRMINLHTFLSLSAGEQRALLSGEELIIKLVFGQKYHWL